MKSFGRKEEIDQVALKLYAAMDPTKGRRHEEDLVAMKVTSVEIEHALQWLWSWQSNSAFKQRAASLVAGLGFAELAATVGDLKQLR